MTIPFDDDLVEQVTHTLRLRPPNHDALVALAQTLSTAVVGTEMIADLATGVGKTYIAGALLDYLFESGIRNIVIVTPGTAIQAKTVGNLTPGHPKYLSGLQSKPLVITLDSLERGEVGDALEDPERFKVFVFTVQSLLRPNTQDAFRAHRAHETLGQALYAYLQAADDLVVIADEHHVYFSGNAKKFEAAISDMRPLALVGLTATPHESTRDKVVFRYPLSEAIADGHVKIPVLVSRRDGVSDLATQLADGKALLDAKAAAMRAYCQQTRQPYIEPVMFVVAQTIDEAASLRDMLIGPEFFGAEEQVLLVTSDEPDKALDQLYHLEDPDSPVRVVVSVSMLKEGWDVKNVYVIAAVRAMESQLLTEQILGRGMRLPFETRTGNAMLDTVEVLSHRAFADLLKQARVLVEETLGDRAAGATVVVDPLAGQAAAGVPAAQSGVLSTGFLDDQDHIVEIRTAAAAPADAAGQPIGLDQTRVGVAIASVDSRIAEGQAAVAALTRTYAPRSPGGIRLPLYIPKVTTRWDRELLSLTQLNHTDVEALGRQFSDDHAPTLNRKAVDAQRNLLGRVEAVITDQVDEVYATQIAMPYGTIESDLVSRLMSTNGVAATASEANAALSVSRSFLAGAGVTPETPWRVEHARLATARLTEWIAAKQASMPTQKIQQVSQVLWPEYPERMETRPPANRQLITASKEFQRGYPYIGWSKSIYEISSFDAYSTEFRLATLFETTPGIKAWIRVDSLVPLRISYAAGARMRDYEPDFIVIDDQEVRWIVEGKADSEMTDALVLAKRDAAHSWISAVNASPNIHDSWGYILASESVIAHADSWMALKSGAQVFR